MADRDIETETSGTANRPVERTTERQPQDSEAYQRDDTDVYQTRDRGMGAADEVDEFHETLAEPMPNRTYRSEIEAADQPTAIEQLVRYVAVLLDLLLAVRFVVSLFSVNTTNSFVAFIFGLTNWLVAPFQAIFGQPTAASNHGYFDWAALAAIVVVSILAALIIRLLHGPRTTPEY